MSDDDPAPLGDEPDATIDGAVDRAVDGADDEDVEGHVDSGSPTTLDTGTSVGMPAVQALRKARRRNRMAELEWFELLYRVYLAAFIGGGAFLFLSGLVEDDPLDAAGVADVAAHGPAVLGVAAIVMVALGLRSGANGGPLAIEDADVRHVLLAPVSHQRALMHPTVQRFRTMCFAGALAGGVAGQLASKRLPGTGLAWTMSGAVFGVACGALFVASAVAAHGLHVPRWLATLLGTALVGWQVVAAVEPDGTHVPGPADKLGEVALWGMEVHAVDITALIAVALLCALAIVLLRRFSLEALARRSALVGQLRFAVTLQDLRTVMVLRRQLAQEHPRVRPWIGIGKRGRTPAVWRRGWHGVMRFPSTRLLRMVILVAVAAGCQVLAWRGTSPAIIGSGIALFVLGLELLEPFSQEIDQSDRADSLPVVRGELYLRLLGPSAVLAVPCAVIGGAVAWALEPSVTTVQVAAIVSLPVVLGGMAGSALNILSGAPDPAVSSTEQTLMPPEVAGTTTLVKAIFPVAVSVVASTPVLAARSAAEEGYSPAAGGLRLALLPLLIAFLTVGWVRFRDDIKQWMRNSAREGNAMRAQSQAGRQ